MAGHYEARVSERGDGRYVNAVAMRHHTLVSDEPERLGGDDLGPNPFDLLCASLGACKSITMRMYAERKGWSVDHLEVTVTHHRERGVDSFICQLSIDGDLANEERDELIEVSRRCPVQKVLSQATVVETVA